MPICESGDERHTTSSPGCRAAGCISLLARCYHGFMATLYIRDVSEDVAATLKVRAVAQGLSLSAYVAGELAKIARRPTNEEIVARLRVKDRAGGPSAEDIVTAVQAGRR